MSFSLDPFTPEFARDPYSIYRYLREHAPVYYHEPWDMWLFSRFADVHSLATDKRLVRTLEHVMTEAEIAEKRNAEGWGDTPNFSRYVRVNILDSEGEMHDRLRRLVFKTFTAAKINALRGDIQRLVDEQIEAIRPLGRIDFIEDFVGPIPGLIIGQLLGVPAGDCYRLRIWSENIVQFYDKDRSDDDRHLAETAAGEFARYLIELSVERRSEPRDDLISVLVEAQSRGELNTDELIATCMIMLMAGHGSTIDVTGNGMLALLRNPEQMTKLRNDPSLIHTAVQEMFRYDPPLPLFHRLVSEDMEFQGRSFSRGSKVGLMYGAANRDPEQFENPDQFDIARSPNRHIAFGKGAHFCLGNHLARLDMEVIFTTLLREIPQLALDGDDPEFRPGITARGLKSLPMLLG